MLKELRDMVFLKTTIQKGFYIMVKKINKDVMATLDMEVGAGGVSKYPWDDISVDEGFYIPLSDLKRTDYRPTVPDEGWSEVYLS